MNKYEIIGIVGEGAYGIVYKAKCKETGEFGKSRHSFRLIKFAEKCQFQCIFARKINLRQELLLTHRFCLPD